MIPIHKEAKDCFSGILKGNFGLYLNKFIEVDDNTFKVFLTNKKDTKDKGDKSREEWIRKYDNLCSSSKDLLKKRQFDQVNVCERYYSAGYEKIVITAKLIAPMIVGLGENHPSETGITLDHNMGIPYIPASSIKGVVRLAHTIGLLKDDDGMWLQESVMRSLYDFDEKKTDLLLDNEKNHIPAMFGNTDLKGGIIFMDAYPVDCPRLKVDIMNPHYGDYYRGDRGPTDDQMPVPIKFLVVDKGAEFVFRALIKPAEKLQADLVDLCKKALENAITEEGIGAKTALGYGRFAIGKWDEPDFIKKKLEEKRLEAEKEAEQKRLVGMSEDDRLIEEIKMIPNDNHEIKQLVAKCFEKTKDKNVFVILKQRLQELEKWKLPKAKQRKQEIRDRNKKIEDMIQ